MNKKIISALLCGTMILGAASPVMAGVADDQKIALVGKSARGSCKIFPGDS